MFTLLLSACGPLVDLDHLFRHGNHPPPSEPGNGNGGTPDICTNCGEYPCNCPPPTITLTTPVTSAALQNAVNMVAPGGTITLPGGPHNMPSENITVNKHITLATVGATTLVLDNVRDTSSFRIEDGGRLTIGAGVTLQQSNVSIGGDDYPEYGLINVSAGGELVLEDGAELIGTNLHKGAIRVAGGGAFTMRGGTISGNWRRSAVIVGTGAVFNMSGGLITGILSINGTMDGFAVTVDGSFTMSESAQISGNGGGQNTSTVRVRNGGVFTMNGGEITGNTASGVLVGNNIVMVNSGGRFTMNGGTISGNTVTGAESHALRVAAGGIFDGPGSDGPFPNAFIFDNGGREVFIED